MPQAWAGEQGEVAPEAPCLTDDPASSGSLLAGHEKGFSTTCWRSRDQFGGKRGAEVEERSHCPTAGTLEGDTPETGAPFQGEEFVGNHEKPCQTYPAIRRHPEEGGHFHLHRQDPLPSIGENLPHG